MNDILLIIILLINSISMLGGFIILTALFVKKIKEEKNISPPAEDPLKNIKYSTKLLESTRSIINSMAYTEFRMFIDNNEISKVSKSQVSELAKNVAIKVRKSIDNNNIDFNHTIFSKEFFDEYIIQFSLMILKQLWENYYESNN